jgi:hypothetical protein
LIGFSIAREAAFGRLFILGFALLHGGEWELGSFSGLPFRFPGKDAAAPEKMQRHQGSRGNYEACLVLTNGLA